MIIPSQRLYGLLLLGMVIALVLAVVFNQPSSIWGTLGFDAVVLSLAVWDGQRVKPYRVTVTRYPLHRL
ncbi:MAG: DUF58 domain-containing protein, partial [Coleofasciculus sp. C2-GNP5-27]